MYHRTNGRVVESSKAARALGFGRGLAIFCALVFVCVAAGATSQHNAKATRATSRPDTIIGDDAGDAERFWGRSVTIAISGIDSRLGVKQAHADANHVLRIWLDQGKIEILSVPRGTYADAGFSSSSLNIIANYRARKGRQAYLRKLAEMTGVGSIDYYVEVGFSQAMGIFELLGFRGSAATALHVLRTRKAFGIGDHQRCYNQAQFIRQMILKHFPRTDGALDALTLRAALAIAETNLRYDVAQMILATLRSKGFPRSERDVSIKLCPRRHQPQQFDLSSPAKVVALGKKLDKALRMRRVMPRKPTFRVESYQARLHRLLIDAARALDQQKPARAIALLERPYQQRAWLQLPEERGRLHFMVLMCATLIEAYEATGNVLKADDVRYFLAQIGEPSHMNLGIRGTTTTPQEPH